MVTCGTRRQVEQTRVSPPQIELSTPNRAFLRGLIVAVCRLGFLGIEYPGFGDAPGSPSELTINAAALSLVKHTMQHSAVPAERLLFVGQSIGCAPALKLCEQWPDAPAVLVSPFMSITQMALDSYPFLKPAQVLGLFRWLIHDKFDNLATAAMLKNEVLVMHGTQDDIVPFSHGVAVHNALLGSRFRGVQGAHHNDILSRKDVMDDLLDFALKN